MRIGILQTGHTPEPLAHLGTYPDLFARLLGGRGLDFSAWPVCDGAMPPSTAAADAWLITGSRHGAYEPHPWIPPLEAFVRALDAERRPLVGICFGHQIVARALGGTVEKFAGGWSVGRRAYRFEDRTLQLNAWHQDQVTVPPPGARTLARSDMCDHAALAWGDHILTIQPHPEFDAAFVAGLLATRAPGVVPPDRMAAAEATLGLPTDAPAAADMMAAVLTRRVPAPAPA